MDDIVIKGTSETPTIEFNSKEGYLLIKGRSIPENSIEFYDPLLKVLERYNDRPSPFTKVDFQLEYFNTSSSKCILDILKQLQNIHLGNAEVAINWYYEEDDDEILEIGEDYSNIINVPFNLKMIPSK
jgi:hypothetical protein